MATGRSARIDRALESWRRQLGDADTMRADDVEELCDHFREVLEERLAQGDDWREAHAAARASMGDPAALVAELARVRRPPRWYQRWSAALAAYAVLHTAWIVVRVAALSVVAYEAKPTPVELGTGVLEASWVSVVAGLVLVIWIANRFRVFSAGSGLTRGSSLAVIVAVMVLGLVLLFSVLFADYWAWWLAPGLPSSPGPWGTISWMLLIGIAAPVAALTAAGVFRQRTPAPRSS